MTAPAIERRRHKRHRGDECGIRVARIRPGYEVSVIDFSLHGILVESIHRLLPGAVVNLRVMGDQASSASPAVSGRIVRCIVARVAADRIWYRGAIALDGPLPQAGTVDTHGYQLPVDDRRPNRGGGARNTHDSL